MDAKLQQRLRPYSMEPAPLGQEDLPRYIQQELRKIESALQPLIESYSPQAFADMKNPTAPISITTSWQDITNYTDYIISDTVDSLNINVNPATGRFVVNTDAGSTVAALCWVDVNLGINDLAQNNKIDLQLYNHTTGVATLIDTAYKADVKEDFCSLVSTFTAVAVGGGEFGLQIKATAGFDAVYITGSFGFKYLNYARVETV